MTAKMRSLLLQNAVIATPVALNAHCVVIYAQMCVHVGGVDGMRRQTQMWRRKWKLNNFGGTKLVLL